MKIHVFTQFYRPKDEQRWSEVRECLAKNSINPQIDVLHVLYEKEEDVQHIQVGPKVVLSPLAERLSYGTWLRLSQQLLEPGDVSLLINSDIYLDETLKVLRDDHEQLVAHNVFIALTRYNPAGPVLRLNKDPHWTQDVWGVTVPAKPFPTALLQETAFNLGQPGCDNKIAYVMHSYGFRVANPCRTVRSVHLHAEETRRYDERADKLIGLHAFVHPSATSSTAARLDIELLTRAAEDVTDLHINNWISQRPSFRLSRGAARAGANVGAAAAHTQPGHLVTENAAAYPDVVLLKRHDVDVSLLDFVEKYSALLELHEDEEHYYYVDKGWPNVVRLAKKSLPIDFANLRPVERFVYGFARHKLELHPYAIHDYPRYQGHLYYWQQPARTEQDAWERLKDAPGHNADRGTCNIVIGLPWATFIDLNSFPLALLRLIRERVGRVRTYLESQGIKLRVHTVCQHIFWRRNLAEFTKAGITDLWTSHKVKGEDRLNGLRLHAWPLYPVNVFDAERSMGLTRKPILERPLFASFTGAYMPHYISDVRQRLLELKSRQDYFIRLTDLWHFNNAVYGEQLSFRKAVQTKTEQIDTSKYNLLLSDSKFCLCPSGAGPNSIRLWEALGAGAIPVILADSYELPRLTKLHNKPRASWGEAVIIHPEHELAALDARLRAIKPAELHEMQRAGEIIHRAVWSQNIVLE